MDKIVKDFLAANAKSPVVSATAKGNGGEGLIYRLKSGKIFNLSREECEEVGHPRWDTNNE